MDSFWLQDCALPHYPPLEQDETAQAAVIGGGIAGILCAYFLTKAGVRCVLVEADRICCGTTAHTTAKLTAQHGLLYAQLLRRAGREQAAQVLGWKTVSCLDEGGALRSIGDIHEEIWSLAAPLL